MALNTEQIMVLHWFYNCNEKGRPASYEGSIQHFGQVLNISDPMNVIMSMLNMGLIKIDKTKLEVSITKEGIKHYQSLKRK